MERLSIELWGEKGYNTFSRKESGARCSLMEVGALRGVPKVAAVHDMSGLGRCSLAVALPVLSVMGAQCCPMQTAYLSAHTGFPASKQSAFVDLTEGMAQTIGHWEELGSRFDAVYSGFLGSERQIGLLHAFLDSPAAQEALLLVDPVMGDHGQVYRTYTPDMCRNMAGLAARASLITPNLTEAAILLEEEYRNAPKDREGTARWLERLCLNGRRSVVLTGVSFQPGAIGAGCFDRETGEMSFPMAPQEQGQFSGTGDLFASICLGGILRGQGLASAAELAVEFVHRCVAETIKRGSPVLDGVCFEPLLGTLC
jgi:pyridoxine kinase